MAGWLMVVLSIHVSRFEVGGWVEDFVRSRPSEEG